MSEDPNEIQPGEVAPVSAIIPCYRCADTLRRAVLSVVRQTVVPFEIVLVDDASRDGTADAMSRIHEEFVRIPIRMISLPSNRGPGHARNAGWESARGQYVAFLDADDSWHPQKLALQLSVMRLNPEVALSGHPIPRFSDIANSRMFPGAGAGSPISARQLLVRNWFGTSSVILRRNLTYRFHGEQRYGEDYRLWLQIVYEHHKALWLDMDLAFRYKAPYGESGLTSHLLSMEMGELKNYWALRNSGHIGSLTATGLSAFSLAKFARRIALTALRRIGVR